MRIAVLTDAHANLPALQAALAAIRRIGVDAVWHTGDAIGIGPHPAEVLDALLAQPDARLVMGNHDEWFVTGLPPSWPEWMSPGEARHVEWVHAQLDPALREVVAGWAYDVEEDVEGVRVRFLHYPLDGGRMRRFRTLQSADEADALFEGIGANLVFYGHHHPFSDLQGRARYVNPGALGCHTEPLARFAILEAAAGRYTLTHHAAPYDPAPLLADLFARGVPEADFILANFLPRAR